MGLGIMHPVPFLLYHTPTFQSVVDSIANTLIATFVGGIFCTLR